MQKTLLITGMSGTLAPVVAKHFQQHGWDIVEWDHHQVDPQSSEQSRAFTDRLNIDAICHLAMGSPQWAGELAELAKLRDIPFVFTSTVMVFDNGSDGPYSIFDERTSSEEYGKYKIHCEDAIWKTNTEAMIARIGWQIGTPAQGGNNMLEILNQQANETGKVLASTLWVPSTSRMIDTADGLLKLIEHPIKGLHHFDSNFESQWSFAELVTALNDHYQLNWAIEPTKDYIHDQRLAPIHFNLASLDNVLNKNN
jgi:dTDP-4-dehydrorhamnose reductase